MRKEDRREIGRQRGWTSGKHNFESYICNSIDESFVKFLVRTEWFIWRQSTCMCAHVRRCMCVCAYTCVCVVYMCVCVDVRLCFACLSAVSSHVERDDALAIGMKI